MVVGAVRIEAGPTRGEDDDARVVEPEKAPRWPGGHGN